MRYTRSMYPPRVSDGEVRALIRELMVGSTLPSGAVIRAALSERFGSRGGVARIYRLLADEQVRLAPSAAPGSIEALQRELQLTRDKLARAEAREDAHQLRWAQEVDQLRCQLALLDPQAQRSQFSRDADPLLRHRLQAAELRAAALERQLYELRHMRGQGGEGAVAEDATNSDGESVSGVWNDT
jgi:hypothetical protein